MQPLPLAMLGWQELLIVGLFALLLFGKRLPEVARSLGKSVVSFKRGLRDFEEEVESASRTDTGRQLPHKEPLEPLAAPAGEAEHAAAAASPTSTARGEPAA